jgi:hypothetical protein
MFHSGIATYLYGIGPLHNEHLSPSAKQCGFFYVYIKIMAIFWDDKKIC